MQSIQSNWNMSLNFPGQNEEIIETTETLVLLMEEILHQLRLAVYPIIYKVLYIPGGAGFLPSTV